MNYSNPMVTYNEIIEALKAILESSKTNGYLDDYSFLNVKYDILNKSPLYEEQEQALIQAIQSIEKTIDAADKVIRENLKSVLDEITASSIFVLPTRYKKDEEYRKLAAQDEFVTKLRSMSLPLEVLYDVTSEETKPVEEDAVAEVVEEEQVAEEVVVEEKVEEVEPPEEVEVEEIPALSEEEYDYYSRVKLGNIKNAFAVTEEQKQKLKEYVQHKEENEKEEIASLVEEEDPLESVSLVLDEEGKEEESPVEEEQEEPKEEIVEEPVVPEEEEEETTPAEEEKVEKEEVEATEEKEEDFSTDVIPKEEKVEETPEQEEVEPSAVEEKEETSKEEKKETPKKEEKVKETKKEDSKAKKEEKEEEATDEKKAAINRIQLIKKALDKAKEKENAQLVQILEQQLKKEIEMLKS